VSHSHRPGREEYLAMRQQVLERDGWRCQGCGRRENLQMHHVDLRSRGGVDNEANLITLCVACHARVHGVRGE
jgi:5-methylcytosine-specific restriction endonuclease McrA